MRQGAREGEVKGRQGWERWRGRMERCGAGGRGDREGEREVEREGMCLTQNTLIKPVLLVTEISRN